MDIADKYTIYSLGDAALTIDFGNVINMTINSIVFKLFHQFQKSKLPGILDVIPAYSTITVLYDIVALRENGRTAFEVVVEWITKTIMSAGLKELPAKRQINVPVCYSTAFGLDLQQIAEEKKIHVEKLIQLHTSKKYHVYMIGYMPGFPYMGEVDDRITIPRKNKPRVSVPAGSVGIAGKQTGIYSLQSPGGWQIIGRTPLQLFNKQNNDAVLFQPGDEVTFYPISEDEFKNYQDRHS